MAKSNYEIDKISSDTVRTLLNGLKGPWYLKWDNVNRNLTAQCCNCGVRLDIQLRSKTLITELTSKLSHRCISP